MIREGVPSGPEKLSYTSVRLESTAMLVDPAALDIAVAVTVVASAIPKSDALDDEAPLTSCARGDEAVHENGASG